MSGLSARVVTLDATRPLRREGVLLVSIQTWISVVSVTVAIGSLACNVWLGWLARRPRISIDAGRMPVGALDWPSRDQGTFAVDDPRSTVDFLACTVAVADSTVITRAGLIPPDAVGRWPRLLRKARKARVDLTGAEYVASAASPDSGLREHGVGLAQIPDEYDLLRLPRQVSNDKLVLRLDVETTVTSAVRPTSPVCVWIETESGRLVYSAPSTAWERRYRGIAHREGDSLVPGPPPLASDRSDGPRHQYDT